jgi:hypothetical protein
MQSLAEHTNMIAAHAVVWPPRPNALDMRELAAE